MHIVEGMLRLLWHIDIKNCYWFFLLQGTSLSNFHKCSFGVCTSHSKSKPQLAAARAAGSVRAFNGAVATDVFFWGIGFSSTEIEVEVGPRDDDKRICSDRSRCQNRKSDLGRHRNYILELRSIVSDSQDHDNTLFNLNSGHDMVPWSLLSRVHCGTLRDWFLPPNRFAFFLRWFCASCCCDCDNPSILAPYSITTGLS